ncbi:MAG: hypothetical protein ACJAVI_005913 [Candidatus Azotimanducaceae bacterium]|jgi:hypothetical protein
MNLHWLFYLEKRLAYSIFGLICKCSASNVEFFQQINRIGRLVAEIDEHETEGRFKMIRNGGEFWLVVDLNRSKYAPAVQVLPSALPPFLVMGSLPFC